MKDELVKKHVNEHIDKFVNMGTRHDTLLKALEVYLSVLNDTTGITAVTHKSAVIIQVTDHILIGFGAHSYIKAYLRKWNSDFGRGTHRLVEWIMSVGLDVHIIDAQWLPPFVSEIDKNGGHWVLVNVKDEIHELCQRACQK